MHHNIQKKSFSYHNFYLFFPICKRKEFKLFHLLENFKKKVLMHRPSIRKSLDYFTLQFAFAWKCINKLLFDWSDIRCFKFERNLNFYKVNCLALFCFVHSSVVVLQHQRPSSSLKLVTFPFSVTQLQPWLIDLVGINKARRV